MPRTSEITIPHDMLRRRVVDVPFYLRDVVGLIATALLGAGMASWALVLAVQMMDGPQ